MSVTQRGITSESSYLPHFKLKVPLRPGGESKSGMISLNRTLTQKVLPPGKEVIETDDINATIECVAVS